MDYGKGESVARAETGPALRALEGTVRARHLEQQTEQALCPTPATDAVVARTTEYYALAPDSMRAAGCRADDEVLAHISPATSVRAPASRFRAELFVCGRAIGGAHHHHHHHHRRWHIAGHAVSGDSSRRNLE